MPDQLGCSSFARLHELRPLPVTDYDRSSDSWQILAPLSEGTAGPDLGEEIMV